MMALGFVLVALGAAGIAATYVLYPALLWLFVRPRAAPARAAQWPGLRVFIPVHNERDLIALKVRDLLEQDYPAGALEVVVVDDGSIDGTAEVVAAEFGDSVRVVRNAANAGKNVALNAAMAQLAPHPPLVATTDADAFLAPGALKALVAHFADDRVGLAAARAQYARNGRAQFAEQRYFGYESLIREMESRDAGCVSISGVLEVHRSNLWVPLPTDVATDMATALVVLAAGFGVIVDGRAVVSTKSGEGVGSELRRKVRTIRRGLRAIRWQWERLPRSARARLFAHKLMRYCAVPFQAMILAGAAVMSAAGSRAASMALWLQIAAYLLVGLGGLLAGSSRVASRPARLLTSAYYFQVVHLLAGIELLRWAIGAQSTAPAWSPARPLSESVAAVPVVPSEQGSKPSIRDVA